MRVRAIAVAAAIFLVAAAGTAAAVEDRYQSTRPGTNNPRCTGGASASAVTADTSPLVEATGGEENSPVPREKVKVPLSVSIGDETVVNQCTGENWDGQDPNTRDSRSETRADEDGDIYVNPRGDCSGYDDGDADDQNDGDNPSQGCEGGTDRPSLTDPVHFRVTGDVDSTAAGEDDNEFTVYANVEGYGLLRLGPAANFDQSRQGGYVALYGEDHSDQIFSEDGLVGGITGPLPVIQEFDGNVICVPFDFAQGGQCGEGDCTQSRYQSDSKPCPRDNTDLSTVEFGYGWAPAPSVSAPSPNQLP